MQTLFWKLFGAFWLTTIVILTVTIFMSFRLADYSNEVIDALEEVSLQEILQTDGMEGLRKYLTNPSNFPPGRTVYVINGAGKDVAGRELPPRLQRRMQRAWSGIESRRRDRPRRRPFSRLPVLETDSGEPLLAVPGPVQPPMFGVLSFAHVRWLVLIMAAPISLLIFWRLSRSLARPVSRISATASRLARGDMSARVGLSGNDEIGQLAEQFDSMAGELESQSKNRRELFRNIAHELRAPLTRMQIATDLLERKPETAPEQVERVRYEIGRIENLTRQVLSLARAEQLSDSKDVTALGTVITQIVNDARFEAEAKKVEVHCEVPEGDLRIRGNTEAIASAIENVVRNAVQVTPSGGEVSVMVTNDDPREVTVTDSGPGVDEAMLNRIFEPFYRVDTNRPGAGIGLAIAQRVLRQVGGSIAASNRSGGGLQVTMRFPAAT